jgi:hypothetical protein
MAFGFVNRFIYHLQVVTTNNYNTIADFHTTNHYTLNLLSLLSLVVTWEQLSTMAIPLQYRSTHAHTASERIHRERRLQHLFHCCVTSPRTCLPNRTIATVVRVKYRHTSFTVACWHYLTMAVSLPPQFLHSANTTNIYYIPVCVRFSVYVSLPTFEIK